MKWVCLLWTLESKGSLPIPQFSSYHCTYFKNERIQFKERYLIKNKVSFIKKKTGLYQYNEDDVFIYVMISNEIVSLYKYTSKQTEAICCVSMLFESLVKFKN